MYCPKCYEEIEHFNYRASYSETTYGRSWGLCDFDGGNIECHDSESDGSDNWEEDNFEYLCPQCDVAIEESELLEEPIDPDELVEPKSEESADDFNKLNLIK